MVYSGIECDTRWRTHHHRDAPYCSAERFTIGYEVAHYNIITLPFQTGSAVLLWAENNLPRCSERTTADLKVWSFVHALSLKQARVVHRLLVFPLSAAWSFRQPQYFFQRINCLWPYKYHLYAIVRKTLFRRIENTVKPYRLTGMNLWNARRLLVGKLCPTCCFYISKGKLIFNTGELVFFRFFLFQRAAKGTLLCKSSQRIF